MPLLLAVLALVLCVWRDLDRKDEEIPFAGTHLLLVRVIHPVIKRTARLSEATSLSDNKLRPRCNDYLSVLIEAGEAICLVECR